MGDEIFSLVSAAIEMVFSEMYNALFSRSNVFTYFQGSPSVYRSKCKCLFVDRTNVSFSVKSVFFCLLFQYLIFFQEVLLQEELLLQTLANFQGASIFLSNKYHFPGRLI